MEFSSVNHDADFRKQLIKMGEKLAELRQKKGYSSHETFAYDFELPRVHYWRIEKGKSNITFKSLMKLLKIHEVTLKDFFNSLPKD